MTEPLVEVDDRSGFELPSDISADELAHVMATVLAAEGVAGDASAGLHLVTEDEIAGLNESHMDSSGPTDVLSFPVDGAGGSDPSGGPSLVGDVLVSPAVAARQAATHAGTVADECRLLVVHGSLHLTGWDHDDDESRRAMWHREREVLEQAGMSPTLDPWTEP